MCEQVHVHVQTFVQSVHECVYKQAHTCLVCKCMCTMGSYMQSFGANNNGFGNLSCLYGFQAGGEKRLLGKADFVAWLHVHVSSWVCFN